MRVNQSKKLNLYEKLLIFSMITGNGLSFHKIYLYHIFMSFNLLIFFYLLIKKIFKLNKKSIKDNIIVIIFFSYGFFNCFLAEDYFLALKHQIYIFIGVNLYFTTKYLLNKNEKEFFKILKIIFIFSCFIGFLETLQIIRWYTGPYGLSKDIPTTFYWNPNNYATFLIIIFPFLVFGKCKNLWSKIFMLVLTLYLLYKTDSRTNNIAILIEIFIMIVIIFKEKNIYNKIFIFLCTFIGIFQLKDKIYLILKVLYEFIIVSERRQDSLGTRKMLILNLLAELKKINVFLFGLGGGNSILVHMKKNNTHGILSTHNYIFDFLVEYGVFIFGILIFYYIRLIYRNFQNYLKTKNYINKSIFISLIGTLIGLNSMSIVVYFFPFWILIAIADFYAENSKVVNM